MENEFTWLSILGSNSPAIVTALTAIITSAITGVITWFISTSQSKAKERELLHQFDFNSKKLLFNFYKDSLEKNTENMLKTHNQLGKLYGGIQALDEEYREEALLGATSMVSDMFANFEIAMGETKYELKKEGMETGRNLDLVNKMEEILSEINTTITVDNCKDIYFKTMLLISIGGMIETSLLENKIENIFGIHKTTETQD